MICIRCHKYALRGWTVNVTLAGGMPILRSVICEQCIIEEMSASGGVNVPIPSPQPTDDNRRHDYRVYFEPFTSVLATQEHE